MKNCSNEIRSNEIRIRQELPVPFLNFLGRTATATVTILVQDREDEIPYFEQKKYIGSVLENLEDQTIISVQAIDKGRAHHMFSRFLKQRIYEIFHEIFFVWFFYKVVFFY